MSTPPSLASIAAVVTGLVFVTISRDRPLFLFSQGTGEVERTRAKSARKAFCRAGDAALQAPLAALLLTCVTKRFFYTVNRISL